MEGQRVRIRLKGGSLFVNGAKVITPNVFASNGVIHVINAVLIPPSM
ncbi:MAG: fasciclin domain-containing protein [Gaiellales bacterium]